MSLLLCPISSCRLCYLLSLISLQNLLLLSPKSSSLCFEHFPFSFLDLERKGILIYGTDNLMVAFSVYRLGLPDPEGNMCLCEGGMGVYCIRFVVHMEPEVT